MKNANKPAMPTIEKDTEIHRETWEEVHYYTPQTGLTKLELIASMAMQGMLANPEYDIHLQKVDHYADGRYIHKAAVHFAKALLQELEGELDD